MLTPCFWAFTCFFQASNHGPLNGNKIMVFMLFSQPSQTQDKPKAYNGTTNKFIGHQWQSKKEHSETSLPMTAHNKINPAIK